MSLNLGSLTRIQGLLVLAGCGSAETLSSPPPIPAEPAGLRISAVSPEMFEGSVALIRADWVDERGGVFPRIPSISWTVDDPAVALASSSGPVDRNEALLTALASGSTLLRGSAGGHTASVAVTVVPVLSSLPSTLSVEFRVVEFQEPSDWTSWYYAPQVRVTATGVDDVRVLGIRLEVSGLRTALQACTSTPLGNGETRELFPEAYGDFPLTLSGGRRASQRTATAFLSFSDGSGEEVQTFRLSGPIEGRGIPRTVPADQSRWSLCSGV
jgi:hypothetical protein